MTQIATIKAVINSAYSLNKFDKKFDATILNIFGEFNKNLSEIKDKKINILNFYNLNISRYLPKHGKISSRFSFIIFFFTRFFSSVENFEKKKS